MPKRNSTEWRKYKEACRWIAESRAGFRCEVLIDGVRCGRQFVPELIQPINFMHKESRNGKTNEWVRDPANIIFGCSKHHIDEHTKGIEVIGVDYSEDIQYVQE